jgi:phospholipase/carboxylesterase
MIKKTVETIGELDCVVVNQLNNTSPAAAVILCHGFGAPGTDLVSLGREFMSVDPKLEKAIYYFPEAPIMLDPGYDARAWWMIDVEKIQELMASGQTRELRSTSPDNLPFCRDAIFQLIEHIKQTHMLAAEKIIVGGFSQGSVLSTDVALNYPEALGGLIVWSGALICEADWTAAAKSKEQAGQTLPVIQTHGMADPIVPLAGSEDLRDMLVANGFSVEYKTFDGQHTIPMEGLQMAAELIASIV